MHGLRIGAQVGLASDHDCRGVVVDSHDRDWLVYWTWTALATWHDSALLWLREKPTEPDYRPIECRVTDKYNHPVLAYGAVPGPEGSLAVELLLRSELIAAALEAEVLVVKCCDDAQALYAEMRRRGWLHSMTPEVATEVKP